MTKASFRALAALLFLIGLALRLLGARGDLWMDEIWTWFTAERMTSLGEALTSTPDENNHVLNTWIVYLLGPDRAGLAYRLPAVLAGAGTVALAGLLARRWAGRAEALLAMGLVAASYPLVHYSSEARGYAFAMAAALGAALLLERAIDRPSLRRDLLVSAAVVAGYLAQLMFVYAHAALVVATVAARAGGDGQERAGVGRRAFFVLRPHAVPFAFVGWLYFVHVRRLVNSGGNRYDLGDVLARTGSLLVGGPWEGPGALAAAGMAVAGCALGAALLWRRRAHAALLVGGMVVAPALLVAAIGRTAVYPRYFLIAGLFALVAAALALGWCLRRGRAGAVLAAVLVLAFAAGTSAHMTRFLRWGRGSYAQAIEAMRTAAGIRDLEIGSDHDYRNHMVLAFHAARLDPPADLAYHREGGWPRRGPEWVLLHSPDPEEKPDPLFEDARGNRYHLQATYPFAGLSGWSWFLYRNERRL